jgi:DNA-binding beta-propeller fold protein YncE
LLIVDSTDGKVIATFPIGAGSDGTAFDAQRKRIFSSNREGTLSVIYAKDARHFVPLGEVPTQLLARTMAVDAESGRVFLVAADRVEVNPTATDPRKRYAVKPGSVRVLFVDPAPAAGEAK